MKHCLYILIAIVYCFPQCIYAQTEAEAELADKYFLDGEYEPAKELYEKLSRKELSEKNATRLVSCYELLGEFEEAEKFLDRSIKRNSQMILLPVLKAMLLEKVGKLKQSDKLYQDIINKKLVFEGHFVQIGAYLYQSGKLDRALQTYKQGRKRLKNNYAFGREIANIHQQLGEYAEATNEYLNVYYDNPGDRSTVNLEILNMVQDESQDAIEQSLLKAIDKSPNDQGIRTFLYEYYVLVENFFEAFVQVKSIDRLYRQEGERVFDFAETMRNNKRYSLSNKAFDYLIDRKKDSRYFYQAHMGKAINNELKAFDQIPIDIASVKEAVENYESLLKEYGRSPAYFEAIYRQAKLQVFYTYELEEALTNMTNLTQLLPKKEQWAKGKILMGDILLMQQDFTGSKAAYTEVSEIFANGNPQIRAMAKFKLAQLSYYKGEFNLSQALLSAIKDNTSNDISNDAIQLNLLIIDNTGLDTSTTALEIFANAQLLIYQRKIEEAMKIMDSLSYEYPTHTLADEILWEKAQVFLNAGNIELALDFIDRILEGFVYDIYGDDALYMKARIYDYNLKNPEIAMQTYLEFLGKFPGSLYSVEVRKRIRELRKEGS